METLESVRSIVGTLTSFGLTQVVVVGGLIAVVIWKRTRSMHSLMAKIWQLFHGKQECKDKLVRGFFEEQTVIMQFRFTTGLPVRTLKHTYAVIAWASEHQENLDQVAACGSYFDLENAKLRDKKDLAKWWQIVAGILVAMAFVLAFTTSCFGVFYDEAVLQLKTSGIFFTLSEDRAKRFGRYDGLTLSQCDAGVEFSSTGFAVNDAKVICNTFKQQSAKPMVIKIVREQQATSAILAGFFGVFLWVIYAWFIAAASADEMFKRLKRRQEREADQEISNAPVSKTEEKHLVNL